MRLLPILILATAFLTMFLPGCGRDRADDKVKPPVYEDGLSVQAWNALDTSADFDEAMRLQKEAVALLHEGKSREDPVSVLEQMAYFLFSQGDLSEAWDYFNEALDSLSARRWNQPTESVVMLYGDLSQFYHRLGMIRLALQYSDSAMAVSRRLDGALMPDLWRFRSQIYANEGRTAEAFRCFDNADSAIRAYCPPQDTAYQLAFVDGYRANLILANNPSPDSVAIAVSLLEHCRGLVDDYYFLEYLGYLGYANYLNGDKNKGIEQMEQAVEQMRQLGDLELTLNLTRRLIDVYKAEKNDVKVSELYPLYTLLNDSMTSIHSNIDYTTKKVRATIAEARRDNQKLKDNLEKQRRHRLVTVIALCVLAVVFVAAVIIIIRRMRRRRDLERARRISAEAAIAKARNERDSALERLEAIKSEVTGEPDTDILQRIKDIGKNPDAFRRAFDAMYPGYVEDLRRDFPSLTDTDVIFCMLIYLKYGTGEIAEGLNISRASVNSARYRIRSKLTLSKEENLDRFLCSRTPSSSKVPTESV